MKSVFRIGDRVRIPFGRGKILGEISEDRGALGVRGRHLYQVRLFMDPFEPTIYELSEDEIEPVDESSEPEPRMEKKKVERYLIHGGLIAILRSNLSGGPNQPRVWLRPDNVGNVTHTFEPKRGVVGGEVVPCMAIHDDKIFSRKSDEVVSFLQSFDLDREKSQKIVAAIGTAP